MEAKRLKGTGYYSNADFLLWEDRDYGYFEFLDTRTNELTEVKFRRVSTNEFNEIQFSITNSGGGKRKRYSSFAIPAAFAEDFIKLITKVKV